MTGFQPDDLAAIRDEDGSLVGLFAHLAGKPLQQPGADEPEDETPLYHIPRKGAWPCGTAATGPTPPPCGSCP